MPADIDKLRKKMKQLELALCKQSTKRLKQEAADVRELTKILSDISKVLYSGPGVEVKNLGEELFHCCTPFFEKPPTSGLGLK